MKTSKIKEFFSGNKGTLLSLLLVLFVITFLHRIFLSIILLLMIINMQYSSKGKIITSLAYSMFLTITNIVIYIANYYYSQNAIWDLLGVKPILIYVILFGLIVVFSIKEYKSVDLNKNV